MSKSSPNVSNFILAVILLFGNVTMKSPSSSGSTEDCLIFNSDKSVKELKDLAAILYLQNSLESKADDQILQAVNDIINDNNIYKYTAKQLLAYYNYNIGNSSEAKRLFEELLQSTDTPANIKKRSNEMLNAINSKITQ